MLQKKLSQALDSEMREAPGLSRANKWIVALICLSILLGILETEPRLTAGFEQLCAAALLILFVGFFTEYLARLYAAPLNSRYCSLWRYAVTFTSLVDLMVLLSFAFPFFWLEAAPFRMFRAVRLVRLARLGRYSIAMQMISQAVAQRRCELVVSVVAAFGLMPLSSTILYLAERGTQPENFASIPRAMWRSVATVTTVGYGDIVPITALGRIFAAFTATTGIGFIALPTGILAGAFSEGDTWHSHNEIGWPWLKRVAKYSVTTGADWRPTSEP